MNARDLEHGLQLEVDRELMLVIEISTTPVLIPGIELGLELEYVFVPPLLAPLLHPPN